MHAFTVMYALIFSTPSYAPCPIIPWNTDRADRTVFRADVVEVWDKKSLQVLIASWNVGNAPPDGCWNTLPKDGGAYDIIAVGAQECDYSAAVMDPPTPTEGRMLVPADSDKKPITFSEVSLHDW